MDALGAGRNLIRTFKEARQKKSLYHRVREFTGFVPMKYESDDFIVTTARSGTELIKILELRHQVFIEEWQGRQAFHGLDIDEFDFTADHLMIVDKNLNEVVGTYRLINSQLSGKFYSSGEFGLENWLQVPGVKLEMGRACIHPEYRNGNTLDLLWKGLARYIFATRTQYLFGCASVKTTDAITISRVLRTLREYGQWSDEYQIRPNWEYRFHGFGMLGTEPLPPAERRELIPPLLRSYLHAGAKVYGWPALDRDFACTDLLTILDWGRLNPRFQARFIKDQCVP